MHGLIDIKIVSPEGTLIDKVGFTYITFSGSQGLISILPKHAPFLSRVSPGEIVMGTAEGNKEIVRVGGGILKVENNKTIVLLDE